MVILFRRDGIDMAWYRNLYTVDSIRRASATGVSGFLQEEAPPHIPPRRGFLFAHPCPVTKPGPHDNRTLSVHHLVPEVNNQLHACHSLRALPHARPTTHRLGGPTAATPPAARTVLSTRLKGRSSESIRSGSRTSQLRAQAASVSMCIGR